jgi:tRNA-2-methylthio-N6-dimethylallyladenosine synthase
VPAESINRKPEHNVEGRSFYIETIGCQMNEQDSLRISRQLTSAGYRGVTAPAEADILIVNTCTIRKKAEEKVYSLLGRYRAWKKERPGRILAVGGCVAQQDGDRLRVRMPHVDIVFGPHHVSRIEQYIRRRVESGKRVTEISLTEGSADDLECPGVSFEGGLRAFVTIMEGCNNFCSYCIVPYVRGRERSRSAASVRREVAGLAEAGVKDITLLGQNVNAYQAPERQDFRFPSLLRDLQNIPGLERLRFTTSHPKDLSPDLIRCFGEIKPLCEHIHLPLQSGSDRILASMNRKYRIGECLEKIRDLRSRCPDMAITTDMIVGFPGERDGDFEATMKVIRDVRFDNIFSFKYSTRVGTRAAKLKDTVPKRVKGERLDHLQEVQREIALQKNRALEGRCMEVLVEGRSRDGVQSMGRTRTNKIVNFPCDRQLAGRLVDVRIEKGCQNSLQGTRVLSPQGGNRAAVDERLA